MFACISSFFLRLRLGNRSDKDIGPDAERLCCRSRLLLLVPIQLLLGNKSRRSVCPFKLRLHSFSWNRTIRSDTCLITRLRVSMIPTLRQRRKDNRGNHSIYSSCDCVLAIVVTRTLVRTLSGSAVACCSAVAFARTPVFHRLCLRLRLGNRSDKDIVSQKRSLCTCFFACFHAIFIRFSG